MYIVRGLKIELEKRFVSFDLIVGWLDKIVGCEDLVIS